MPKSSSNAYKVTIRHCLQRDNALASLIEELFGLELLGIRDFASASATIVG